jgi:hypothetical protein
VPVLSRLPANLTTTPGPAATRSARKTRLYRQSDMVPSVRPSIVAPLGDRHDRQRVDLRFEVQLIRGAQGDDIERERGRVVAERVSMAACTRVLAVAWAASRR